MAPASAVPLILHRSDAVRIGLLTEYPLSHRAGWQSTVRRIREALEKRGHEIVLLHEAPDPHRATACHGLATNRQLCTDVHARFAVRQ